MTTEIRKQKIKLVALMLMILAFLAVSLTLIFAGGGVVAAAGDFKKGSGTAEDPYQISTVEDFNNINYYPNAYFVQTANIDFAGQNFIMVGDRVNPFKGHYDGGNFLLSNFILDRPASDNVGVFGFVYAGATVKNIHVENAVIIGNSNVGGIAGSSAGTISNSYVNAKISAMQAAGGIVGNNAGNVIGNVNAGTVSVDGFYCGGISGLNYGNISLSYNKGNINAEAYVGGIAGVNNGRDTDAIIERTFNVGSVGGNIKANIAGDNLLGTLQQGRWIENSTTDNAAAFDTGKIYSTKSRPAVEFRSGTAFNDWAEFDDYFMFLENAEYPILKSEYIKVSEVVFDDSVKSEMMPGDGMTVSARVQPSHASVQDIRFSIESGSEYCEFDRETNFIQIKPDAAIGSKIVVSAVADGVSSTFEIEVVPIPVEELKIRVADENYSIIPGGTAQLETQINPNNASIKDVRYMVDSPYADIDYNGLLTVKKEAPVGLTFTVTAQSFYDLNIMATAEFTVAEAKIERVEVIVEKDSFKVTDSISVSGLAIFEDGDFKAAEVNITESTAVGAKIESGYLVAEGVGSITLVAEYGGVTSEPVTVEVLPEPVTAIEFVNGNRFYVNDGLLFVIKVVPSNATHDGVEFEIVGENTIGAKIKGNKLTAEKAGIVTIRACIGEISAEQTVYAEDSENIVQVEDIELEKSSFKITEDLLLSAVLYPSDAIANVYYEIEEDNGTGAVLSGNILKAERVGTIILRAYTSDFSKLIEVKAEKEPVERIFLSGADSFKVTESLQLVTTVLPVNATYRNVVYEIVGENHINATISEDGIVMAEAVGEITVRATADGLSEEFLISVLRKPVTDVKLTSAMSFKHTDKLVLSALALPLNATCRDIVFSIDNGKSTAKNARIEDGNILKADGPGYVILAMTVDGRVYNATVNVLEEPVISVGADTLTYDGNEFRTSGSLSIIPRIYPSYATNQFVKIEIINGKGINARLYLAGHDLDSAGVLSLEVSSETEVYLRADLPGTIKIKVTALGNENLFYDIEVDVLEEYVTDIKIGFEKESAEQKAESTKDILPNGEYIENGYYYYSEIFLLSGGTNNDNTENEGATIIFKNFVFAQNGLQPTYANDCYLMYYLSEEDYLNDRNGTVIQTESTHDSDYLIISDLKLKALDRIGIIWLVAVSEHGEQGIIRSKPVKVTIQPINISEIKRISLNPDTGKISIDNGSAQIKDMFGYEVIVRSGDKIAINELIETNYVGLYLKPYYYSVAPYDITVNLIISDKLGEPFRYEINTNGFKGFLKAPVGQIEDEIVDKTGGQDNSYNVFMIYDFGFWPQGYTANIELDYHLRYMYVYGQSDNPINGLNFTVNSAVTSDEDESFYPYHIVLNDINFTANANKDGIRFYHNAGDEQQNSEGKNYQVTIDVLNNVTIAGGKGEDGVDGRNGTSYIGKARNGTVGDSGEVTWVAGNSPDGGVGGKGGDGKSGGNGTSGTNGKQGGTAIRVDNSDAAAIKVSGGASLTLHGGDGGNGGNGGNGGKGQGGGNGGRGGNGCLRYIVVSNIAGSGGDGGPGGNGGNGGDGGNGGNAGSGAIATNITTIDREDNAQVSLTKGQDGKIGNGGNGGAAGLKGSGGKGGEGGKGSIVFVIYDGPDGNQGKAGNNGKAGKDGTDGTVLPFV